MSSLFKSLKHIQRAYGKPATQDVFTEILAKKKVTRFFVILFSKYKFIKIIVLFLYSVKALLSIPFPKKNGSIVATGTTANEIIYINYIDDCLQDNQIEMIMPNIKKIFSFTNFLLIFKSILHFKRIAKYYKVVSHFHGDDFITGCLRASFVGYYIKAIYSFSRCNPKAILVTSNYTADSCALVVAAKALNIPVIFYPHGVVARCNNPIDIGYDIAIFSGKYGLDLYKENSSDFAPKVLFCGIKGQTIPLKIEFSDVDLPKRVGIFLTAKTNMEVLDTLVDKLSSEWGVEKILIRPHPVDLIRPDFINLSDKKNVYITAKGDSLIENVSAVDLAFVGNSSVHLEILKLGVPTIFYENLDCFEFDINSFVKFRVVPSAKNLNDVNIGNVISFYNGDWKERFRYFDACYGLSEERINTNIKNVLFRMIIEFYGE